MSVDANALERETLERKDREELAKIVGALGGKATSRTRKANLIDQILELTGVTGGGSSPAAAADAKDGAEDGDAAGDDAGKKDAPKKDASGPSSDKGAAKKDAEDEDAGKKDTAASGGGDRSGSQGKDQSPTRNPPGQVGPNGTGGKGSGNQSGSQGAKQGGSTPQGGSGSDGDDDDGGGKRRRRRGRNRDGGNNEEYTGEPIPVAGILDLRDDGYGFLRVDGLLPSKDDCYVSVKQVRQFGLRKGDLVSGGARPAFRNEKNPAIMRIDTVNDVDAETAGSRPVFEERTPVFPAERLDLFEDGDDPDSDDLIGRSIDLLVPVGKGSRVLVAAAPRSGGTTLLQHLVRAVEANEPEATLLVLQVDERPEEITEMRSLVTAGDVHATSVDNTADDHVNVVDLALSRARRLAEAGTDVVVLLDGLTRLARAAHAMSSGSGRAVGGLDVAALETVKRALGTGRNLVDGGSVTVIATAVAGTDSEVDRTVLDTLVPVATATITLDRFAAERREFPAFDVTATGTRHEDLLVDEDGVAAHDALRRRLLDDAGSDEHTGTLARFLHRLRDSGSNEELLSADAD